VKGGEKQIRANPGSPAKHKSFDGIRCQVQETSHEEKAKDGLGSRPLL
jgi:hypothetical protein